ncbi:MAG TPA: electron transport complex subunit RsxC [Oscillospiraceae bacterium]|nr:electron transport complex subunit RsxC [Oscillospiraceae bacterium]
MAKTFERGKEVPHYKKLTENLPIQDLPQPTELIIPLKQHIGAPNRRLVSVGEKVKAGQKIGDSDANISAPVHTGLSGTVREIGSRVTLSGQLEDCVVIDVDPEQDACVYTEEDVSQLSPEQIRRRIREAGIVGMGGAGFPTHVKVNPPTSIDYLILNGCECEPFLTCDHRLMVEEADEMIAGARILSQVLNGAKVIFGIEENKMDAIEVVKAKLASEADMEVIPLEVKYPQGAEKQLIYATTGRVVPLGKLPAEVNVVVQNVATAKAVWEAVKFQRPLTERIVTLTGAAAVQPGNYRVVIGTPLSHLLACTGGLTDRVTKVVLGGPMTGFAQETLAAPIVKGCGGVLALTEELAVKTQEYYSCVRCGKCVDHCPMGLYPNYIGMYGELGRYALAKEWGALDCFECGICAFVCPSQRPIVEFVRRVKRA